jgi:cystathionine beta-lyase/cystathionine gamma-synthase
MSQYNWRNDSYGAIVPSKKIKRIDVYECTTFAHKTAEEGRAIFAGEKAGYAYSRISEGNPTVRKFELAMLGGETGFWSDLYDRYDALAFASGMAAEFILALALCYEKKHIVSSPWVYGGTYALFDKVLPKYCGGIQTTFVENPRDMASWYRAARQDTAFFWTESPANPFGVLDIPAISVVAHSLGIPVFTDNTIVTHALQKPLLLGADGVVISTSKGINGYSNALGGVLVAERELIAKIKNELSPYAGAIIDASPAARMLMGMEDLHERMRVCSHNALDFAKFCFRHRGVQKVRYHFLPNSTFYETAQRQMSGGGPLLSVELCGTMQDTIKALESFRVIIPAPHLGHTDALVVHPASTTHAKVPAEERKRLGISDTLLRFSMGSKQDVSLVKEDFEQALKKL